MISKRESQRKNGVGYAFKRVSFVTRVRVARVTLSAQRVAHSAQRGHISVWPWPADTCAFPDASWSRKGRPGDSGCKHHSTEHTTLHSPLWFKLWFHTYINTYIFYFLAFSSLLAQ